MSFTQNLFIMFYFPLPLTDSFFFSIFLLYPFFYRGYPTSELVHWVTCDSMIWESKKKKKKVFWFLYGIGHFVIWFILMGMINLWWWRLLQLWSGNSFLFFVFLLYDCTISHHLGIVYFSKFSSLDSFTLFSSSIFFIWFTLNQ